MLYAERLHMSGAALTGVRQSTLRRGVQAWRHGTTTYVTQPSVTSPGVTAAAAAWSQVSTTRVLCRAAEAPQRAPPRSRSESAPSECHSRELARPDSVPSRGAGQGRHGHRSHTGEAY